MATLIILHFNYLYINNQGRSQGFIGGGIAGAI